MSKANVQQFFSFVPKLSVIINRIYESLRYYSRGLYLKATTKAKDTALCLRSALRTRTSPRGHIIALCSL